MRILIAILIFWAPSVHAETIAKLITSAGTISIKLNTLQSPNTVANFIGLANGTKKYTSPEGKKIKGVPFYNGLTIHRANSELGIFSGCPLGNGEGWPGFWEPDENAEAHLFNRPGLVAMAKIKGQKKYGSQFFITTHALAYLDKRFTIFGEVVSGMDIVHKISKVTTDITMKPVTPIIVKQVEISQ